MQKSQYKPLKIVELAKLDAERQVKEIAPIIETHQKELAKVAETIATLANSNLLETIKSLTDISKFPDINILDNIRLPEMPTMPSSLYERPALPAITRYDPPVTIRKSDWEVEKENREAYMTELQIQILEQQLNLVKGMQSPRYDQNTGIITFMGKQVEIPLNTNLEMVCRIVLKNNSNMKRKWSWDEIIEANREAVDNYTARQIYTAVRSINEKVAQETQVKDLFISKPTSTVQLNPKFLVK